MGGAVGMNLASGDTPQVLIAPAWRAWGLLRFGQAHRVKPATVIIQGVRDRVVFPVCSQRLLANSRPRGKGAAEVKSLERQLGEKLRTGEYIVEGRLVLICQDDHRCNGEAALRGLGLAVDLLTASNDQQA